MDGFSMSLPRWRWCWCSFLLRSHDRLDVAEQLAVAREHRYIALDNYFAIFKDLRF